MSFLPQALEALKITAARTSKEGTYAKAILTEIARLAEVADDCLREITKQHGAVVNEQAARVRLESTFAKLEDDVRQERDAWDAARRELEARLLAAESSDVGTVLLEGVAMSEERWYWLSSKRMTVCVGTVDGVVRRAAPIIWRFRGQPLSNLEAWMRKQGGFEIEEISQ